MSTDKRRTLRTSCRSISLFVSSLLLLCQCKSGWSTRYGEASSHLQLKKVWETSLSSKRSYAGDYLAQTFAKVTVGEKAAYVGSTEGMFYSLNLDNGKMIWKQKLSGPIFAPALYLSKDTADVMSLVIVGNEAGDVTAMEAETGKIRWTYHYKAPIRSIPVYDQDLLYVLTSDGVLNAIRAKDGEWVWGHERNMLGTLNIRASTSAVVSNGIVYAGFLDGYLVAFQGKSGEILWNQKLVDEQSEFYQIFTPVLKKDTLFVSTYEAGVYALDSKDGSVKWHYDLTKQFHLNAGGIAVGENAESVYVSVGSGGIHCLDGRGHIIWRQLLKDGGETSTPVVWKDYLFFGASEKGLYVVHRLTGALVQYFRITNAQGKVGRWIVPWNGVTEAPTIQGSRVYFVTNHERVYALEIVEK